MSASVPTDIKPLLSPISLGTWALGEEGRRTGQKPAEDKTGIETILAAADLGINMIDTAPSYGDGYAETLVGLTLKRIKRKPLISTKCGLVRENNTFHSRLDPHMILQEFDASRRRLKTDVIDFYQIHKPAPEGQLESAWQTLTELKKGGAARYIGVSNFNLTQLKQVQSLCSVDFIQVHYSMLARDIEPDILPYCAKNQIRVLTYSPIERGLLAGKFLWENMADIPDSDHRKKNPLFTKKMNFDLVERLRPIAQRNHITLSQLAILWILCRQDISSVIAGARLPSQIEETAAAMNLTIPEGEWARVNQILAGFKA